MPRDILMFAYAEERRFERALHAHGQQVTGVGPRHRRIRRHDVRHPRVGVPDVPELGTTTARGERWTPQWPPSAESTAEMRGCR